MISSRLWVQLDTRISPDVKRGTPGASAPWLAQVPLAGRSFFSAPAPQAPRKDQRPHWQGANLNLNGPATSESVTSTAPGCPLAMPNPATGTRIHAISGDGASPAAGERPPGMWTWARGLWPRQPTAARPDKAKFNATVESNWPACQRAEQARALRTRAPLGLFRATGSSRGTVH